MLVQTHDGARARNIIELARDALEIVNAGGQWQLTGPDSAAARRDLVRQVQDLVHELRRLDLRADAERNRAAYQAAQGDRTDTEYAAELLA